MGGRLWKQSEIDYLRRNLGKASIKDIGLVLNRTENAVIQMAYRQGIGAKLNTCDRSYRKLIRQNNSIKRTTYQKRKDEGVCTRCGKRWAEAGRTKCRPCREKAQEWYRNGGHEHLSEYKKRQRAERREKNLCLNCGKPLAPEEIGINSHCARCRKKDMERTTMARLRMRIHGIKRQR